MNTQEQAKPTVVHSGGGADAVYGIGMIGAWVYYFKRVETTEATSRRFSRDLSGRPLWCTTCWCCLRRSSTNE